MPQVCEDSSARRRWSLFGVMTVALVAAFLWTPQGQAVCGSKRFFGVSCPGCGLTRSVTAFAQGRIDESLQFHLFGPLALAVMATLWVVAVAAIARRRDVRSPHSTAFSATLATSLVLLVGYWLARVATGTLP